MVLHEIAKKVFLVTGGSIGLGEVFTKAFVSRGAEHVRFIDIDEKNGIKLEKELNDKFGTGKTKFVKCDVTDETQLSNVYEDLIKERKKIDAVVNNAGLMNDSRAVFKKMIEVNYTALVNSTLKAYEHMRMDKGGAGGTIMNVASQYAIQAVPLTPIYNGTKAAVLQFTQCIGSELHYSRSKVRMITMCYGPTDTSLIHVSKLRAFDEPTCQLLDSIPRDKAQSVDDAAKGTVEAFEHGGCPSTFAVIGGVCTDVTENVNEGYKTFLRGLESLTKLPLPSQ